MKYKQIKAERDLILLVIMINNIESFILLPTDEALVEELIALVTGNQNMLEGWGNVVDGITSMSESLKDNLGSGYSIHLLNPANKDNVLLSMMDGIVFYNVADDF